MPRYWETEGDAAEDGENSDGEEAQHQAINGCARCGEKGHDKKSCPHEQCLTCGRLDHHSTRQCRQGIVCFRCGERGHMIAECTQHRTTRRSRQCVLCGSENHQVASCPTHFRIYYFNTPEDRQAVRNQKWNEFGRREMEVNNGIFSEMDRKRKRVDNSTSSPPDDWDPMQRWCYNCAGLHWGDDCRIPRCNPLRSSGESSVYSENWSNSAPFSKSLGRQLTEVELDQAVAIDGIISDTVGVPKIPPVITPPPPKLSAKERTKLRLKEEAKSRKAARERLAQRNASKEKV